MILVSTRSLFSVYFVGPSQDEASSPEPIAGQVSNYIYLQTLHNNDVQFFTKLSANTVKPVL